MAKQLRDLVVLLAAACAIAGAQESATVTVPDIAKAGETVDIVITLDKAPNFDGGGLTVYVTGPGDLIISSGCETRRGEKVCHYPFHLPEAAPGGTWYVSKISFFTGTRQIDLPFKKLPFQVIAKPDLVFPTSVEVAINPSQVQLFRREATRLQADLQALKAAIASAPGASSKATEDTLIRHVQAEIESLRVTESNFQDLSKAKPLSEEAQVFFEDLRTSYEEVLLALPTKRISSTAEARILTAAWNSSSLAGAGKDNVTYPIVAQAVFRTFEQNELAYALVADTGELTFDLEVSSIPEGATVSYRRRGDPYHDHPNPTDSVIRDLPLAIWFVRFEKLGFRDQEVEHNPFTERNHTVTVQMTKK